MDEQKKTSGSLALNSTPQVITIPPSDPVRDRKLRVAAYARVSSSSEDQLNSFAAQNAHYTELITANPEWEFVDVYADKGITGTSAEKRDDFQRLLADCRRGRVDKILVKSSSRFARNAKECLEAVRELKALGVGVCFEEQGTDTSELAGEFLTAIFAMMDQKESENISDNLRWSIQRRMKNGTYLPPSVPYGYALVDGKITVNKQQAALVRQIFRRYLIGENLQEIADSLNAQEITKRGALKWYSASVRYILSNERYTGDSLWQKTYTTNSMPRVMRRNHGEQEMYYAPNTHPAIISKEEYNAVQTLIKCRAMRKQVQERSPFDKKIFCEKCGLSFRKKVSHEKLFWICRSHANDAKSCTVTQILNTEIEQAFLHLYHKLRHQGISILTQLLTDLQSARKGKLLWSLDIVALNQKIADITRQDQLLAQLKQQGLVDPDIFISRQNELAEQLRAVKLEKERSLEAEEDQTIQQIQELIEALEAGPDFLDAFDGELFRELVDKIIVESNDRLRFRVVNGLELTEPIERTVRCWGATGNGPSATKWSSGRSCSTRQRRRRCAGSTTATWPGPATTLWWTSSRSGASPTMETSPGTRTWRPAFWQTAGTPARVDSHPSSRRGSSTWCRHGDRSGQRPAKRAQPRRNCGSCAAAARRPGWNGRCWAS